MNFQELLLTLSITSTITSTAISTGANFLDKVERGAQEYETKIEKIVEAKDLDEIDKILNFKE